MLSYMGCTGIYKNGKWIIKDKSGETSICDSLGVALIHCRLTKAVGRA